MCHEVGHAFGLPHTDENFDNEDLGNCLDYTDNFAANMHPDKSNYDFLFDLYGSVGGRRILRKNWAPTVNEYPATVKQKLSEALPKMASQMEEAVVEDGWRVLHQNKHGIEHELDLGEGYKARMHRLLVH